MKALVLQTVFRCRAQGHKAGLLALLCLFFQALPAFAQAPPPPPPPPAAAGVPAAAEAPAGAPFQTQGFFKLIFATLDQYSYQVHPFYSLTGEEMFNPAEAAPGGSFDAGSKASDKNSNFLEKAIHTLPPVALEYIWPVNTVFPRAVGVGLDYSHFGQTDKQAGDRRPPPTIPRFEMDTYYTAVPVRLYGFDPREGGINYFVGFSLGVVDGNLLMRGTGANGEDETIGFRQSSVGATRFGIEVNGQQYGFRYELMLVNPRKVKYERNPFPASGEFPDPPTTIDMSGSIIRISLHYFFF